MVQIKRLCLFCAAPWGTERKFSVNLVQTKWLCLNLRNLPPPYIKATPPPLGSLLTALSALPQVVTNRDTQETLLCIAFVFEVSTSEHGAQHHVYKLVKD